MMQNVVPVAGGRAVRRALLYSDTRAQAEFANIEARIGRDRLHREATNVKVLGLRDFRVLGLLGLESALRQRMTYLGFSSGV
jgi:sugar (pentulose or hexulose) kinase